MNKVESGSGIEIHSGVWNAPDIVATVSAIALGSIALTIGILGILGHQGIPLGSFNAISTVFPEACCALIAGVGGALFLVSIGIIIFKCIKNERFKKYYAQDKDLDTKRLFLRDKKYWVVLDGENAIPDCFKVFTHDTHFAFGSVEAFTSKLRELEKDGFKNYETVAPVPPADTVPLPEESKEGHPCLYWIGVTVTLISLPVFIVPFFYPFPYAWTLQTAALGVLTAVSYGIINDQFAIRQSKYYFTLGHTPFHKRLLETDDATANGTIWGIHATWVLGAIAGVVLVLVATVTHSCAINPLYLTPLTLTGSLIVNLYAHVKSKNVEDACEHPILKRRINLFFNEAVIKPKDEYFDTVYLRNVPENERPGWLGVGTRNGIGYGAMPALGGVLLVAIIAARIFLAVG